MVQIYNHAQNYCYLWLRNVYSNWTREHEGETHSSISCFVPLLNPGNTLLSLHYDLDEAVLMTFCVAEKLKSVEHLTVSDVRILDNEKRKSWIYYLQLYNDE